MANCKFCGGPNASIRRHAVPTWFLDDVQADTTVISSYTIYDITGLRAGHFHFPDVVERTHENLTDYWICDSCAYGWIEDMNVAVQEPMTTLLNEDIQDVQSVLDFTGFLSENAALLVRSAFEVVLACDFIVESSSIPDSHYRALNEGHIPAGVSVELSFCEEPSPFRILSGPIENEPDDISRCTYRVAFQAGKMVMMVRHVDGVPYDPDPANVILHPEFIVGEELAIMKNALEIIGWDIIAMEYFNEKARSRENTFLGLYEEPKRRTRKHLDLP